MRTPDLSYVTPTLVDEKGTFEILADGGRQLRYDTPRARFIRPPLCGPPLPIEWLWADRIPRGRVTVIEGPAGAGKTFLTAHLTAHATSGAPWGDGPEGPQRAGDVLYYCSQRESEDVVAPRVAHGGADVDRVIFRAEVDMVDSMRGPIGTRKMEFPQDLNMLEHDLKTCTATRLVVIDPLRDFCATPRLMRKALAVLDDLAGRYKIAIVATIQADVKFTPEGEIRQVARPWDEAARYVWCVTRDPCDPALRRFEPKRTTFCQEPVGLAFRVTVAGALAWEPLTPRLTPFEKCKKWLTARMSGGAVWADQGLRDARAFGFSSGMVFRAREKLQIISDREGGIAGEGAWWWTRDGRPPESLIPASAENAADGQYAQLMHEEKPGEEFVSAISVIEKRDQACPQRSGRKSLSPKSRKAASGPTVVSSRKDQSNGNGDVGEVNGPGHMTDVAADPVSVPGEKISQSEILVNAPLNTVDPERPGERGDVSPPVKPHVIDAGEGARDQTT